MLHLTDIYVKRNASLVYLLNCVGNGRFVQWCMGYSVSVKNKCILYKRLVNCAAVHDKNGDEKQRTSILSVPAQK